MSNDLNPAQLEINNWIIRLDDVARAVEARWGIDRLPGLVSPETQAKWQRHVAKLDDAITSSDLPLVRDLAQGAIRGYARLEVEAVSLGAEKNRPEVWDIRSPETGIHYRVCKTLQDARLWAFQPEAVVYTLEEIARILDKRQLTEQPSVTMREARAEKPNPFDFGKGDAIEF